MCRSPFAEAILKQSDLLRGRNSRRIASAGFVAPGQPSPDTARTVAERRGYDLADHRSRLMELSELRRPSLVVVMEPGQRDAIAAIAGRPRREVLLLGDLDPAPGGSRSVRDPFRRPEAVFEEVYARIDRCVTELAGLLDERAQVPDGGTAST